MTGSELAAWRTGRKLSKTDAAKALGVAYKSYLAYEAGKPKVPVYIGLACAAIAWGLPQWGEPVKGQNVKG